MGSNNTVTKHFRNEKEKQWENGTQTMDANKMSNLWMQNVCPLMVKWMLILLDIIVLFLRSKVFCLFFKVKSYILPFIILPCAQLVSNMEKILFTNYNAVVCSCVIRLVLSAIYWIKTRIHSTVIYKWWSTTYMQSEKVPECKCWGPLLQSKILYFAVLAILFDCITRQVILNILIPLTYNLYMSLNVSFKHYFSHLLFFCEW